MEEQEARQDAARLKTMTAGERSVQLAKGEARKLAKDEDAKSKDPYLTVAQADLLQAVMLGEHRQGTEEAEARQSCGVE